MATRRLGAARGSREHCRDRRRGRRAVEGPHVIPRIPRRSRRRDRHWSGRHRHPRRVRLARDGSGVPARATPWRAEFPFPGRASTGSACNPPRGLHEARAGDGGPPPLPSAGTAKYTGSRTSSSPCTRTGTTRGSRPGRPAVVARRVVPLPLRRRCGRTPTHLVPLRTRRPVADVPLIWPPNDPEIYAAERPAAGSHGSLLVYRTDVFHRAVEMTAPGAARFLLNISYKLAGQDWIGFHTMQYRAASSPHWTSFVEGSSPRELDLFGFPPPGHPIWNAALARRNCRALSEARSHAVVEQQSIWRARRRSRWRTPRARRCGVSR